MSCVNNKEKMSMNFNQMSREISSVCIYTLVEKKNMFSKIFDKFRFITY